MVEDKISRLNIPIQWLKDIVRRNQEFKIDIADLQSYFGGVFFGKSPEVICQYFKDVLLQEGIGVHLDKYEGICDRLTFKNFSEQHIPPYTKDKIYKYQKEIGEHISLLKYAVRINKEFKINFADLSSYFGGDLFEENPEIIHQIYKYVLSKEGIDVSLCKCAGKYEFIFTKFGNLDDLQHNDIPIKRLKFIKKVPLKPWKDPESLFCDTKFLREFLGKEPRKGKECKDDTRKIKRYDNNKNRAKK